MTSGKTQTIEPSDILAVHFECGNCKAATVVPIAKLDPNLALALAMGRCRYCHTEFGLNPGSSEIHTLLEFTAVIANIAHSMKGRNLHLKLEVGCQE